MHTDTRPVAVVTGGKQGLGLASARALAAHGFDVAIGDLQPRDVQVTEIEAELQQLGARTFYAQLDIARLEDHGEFLDAVEDRLGPVHCLVDNAGIAARPLTDVLELNAEAFDAAIEVNLRGTFFLSQQVATRMLNATEPNNPRRSIIVITSVGAEMPSVTRAQYCISKAGLSMMVKVLALRLAAFGIDVHEIRPGFIRTAMTASAGTANLDEAISSGRVPMARWGEPEDVAQAVASLASGQLPYMTGQPIWVAGGLNIPRAT